MHTTRALVLLVAGIGVGYVLLLFVYLLPTEPMRAHLAEAAVVLSGEREYHRVIPGVVSTQLDNYTDSWMMGNAVYDSPRPVYRVLAGGRSMVWCVIWALKRDTGRWITRDTGMDTWCC